MHYLKEKEYEEAFTYLQQAARLAQQATCLRKKSASIIVQGKEIIGQGVNKPPLGVTLTTCLKDSIPKNFKSDRTCCVHAEQHAIVDALQKNPDKLPGARLYFSRINDQGTMVTVGKPYCTI